MWEGRSREASPYPDRERLWVRPRASLYKLFLAAGEALRVLRLPAGVFGQEKEAQETLVKVE